MLERAVLRILDANANRAREGLRVMEDYARFGLDHGQLAGELKELRHSLAGIIGDLLPEALIHRDAPGDVGKSIKTESEGIREGVEDVVIAAGKRAGEALRSIEEFLKTIDAGRASRVETLRYRLYDVERRLSLVFRPANRMWNVRLYVLITQSVCRRPWLETAEQAILGGAECVQLREKGMQAGELLRRARELMALCRRHGVIGIVNDRPDVAVLSGADGVHVGQEDLPPAEARRIVGHGKIVGVSTHNLEQARKAAAEGADYIGVGPLFPSGTKPRSFLSGLSFARQVAEQVKIPAFGIAGITAENIDEVRAAGLCAIAVTAAVAGAEDVRAATAALKARL